MLLSSYSLLPRQTSSSVDETGVGVSHHGRIFPHRHREVKSRLRDRQRLLTSCSSRGGGDDDCGLRLVCPVAPLQIGWQHPRQRIRSFVTGQ